MEFPPRQGPNLPATIHIDIKGSNNTVNINPSNHYNCRCSSRDETLQRQECRIETDQDGRDENFGNQPAAPRPSVSEGMTRDQTGIWQRNTTHPSLVGKKNGSRNEHENFPSKYKPITTLQKQGICLEADKQATNSIDTGFTVDAHPRQVFETDKEILQSIRDTTDTLWKDTDLSDSQMKVVALEGCAEVSLSTVTRYTEGMRLWTLDYIQQRMERFLGRLESKFQSQEMMKFSEGSDHAPCPLGKEKDLGIVVSPAIGQAHDAHSVLVSEFHETQSHLHEDEKQSSDVPIVDDPFELTSNVPTCEFSCKRQRRRRLPTERESPLSARKRTMDTSSSSQENRMVSTNLTPIQTAQENISFHAKLPPHDPKKDYDFENGTGKEPSRGRARAGTVTPSSRDDSGLPKPNSSQDVFSHAKCFSDGFLHSHSLRANSLEPLERTKTFHSKLNSPYTPPPKAPRAKNSVVAHHTQRSENIPEHIISTESHLLSKKLLTKNTETEPGGYVQNLMRALTKNEFLQDCIEQEAR